MVLHIFIQSLIASLFDNRPDETAGVRAGVGRPGVLRLEFNTTALLEERQKHADCREVSETLPVCVNPTKEKEDLECVLSTTCYSND